MTDEELQRNIEEGHEGNGSDERAYRMVFRALQKDPGYPLSPAFASRVISRLKPAATSSHDHVWLVFGLVSIAIAMVVAILKTGFKLNWGALKFLAGYPGLMAFGIVFIVALHLIDRRVVRKI